MPFKQFKQTENSLMDVASQMNKWEKENPQHKIINFQHAIAAMPTSPTNSSPTCVSSLIVFYKENVNPTGSNR